MKTKGLPSLALTILPAVCLALPAPRAHAFNTVTTPGCNTQWQGKLQKVARFMKGAANSWRFQQCVWDAVGYGETTWFGGTYLTTPQESTWTGVYEPCTSTSGTDDAYWAARPVEASTPVFGALNSSNALELTCSTQDTSTAWVTTANLFNYGHTNTERVNLGTRVQSQYPSHQQWNHYYIDRFYSQPSYQVEELAGIILHEILHTHDFHHGESGAIHQCTNYAAFDCAGLDGTPGQRCRMNSLNEIAEACMSEIVEESTYWCGWADDNGYCPNKAPILNTDWVERSYDDISMNIDCVCL
jgi:hypothetical protein